MPKTESLDELIAKNAAEFADQIRAAAQMADKEEEIRIEAERQLAFIDSEESTDVGDVVLGGSFTRPTTAVAGDNFHVDFGPLGSVAFRFVA